MKIYFHTFGCKVNQCETGFMANEALKAGAEISMPENADSIVINSCTVTAEADRKARQYLRRFSRLNPKAKILFTGCYVDRAKEELKVQFPDVKFFPNFQKGNVLKLLGLELLPPPLARSRSFGADTSHPSTSSRRKSGLCSGQAFPLPCFSERTRSFIKIQDGCDGNCSYCIVPKIRNKIFCKNPADVIREVKNYVEADHKEIVLCGVRLGRYRGKREEGSGKLVDLIKELEKINGLHRIRLSSIELGEISDDLIDLMASSKKMCRHLHIPLQSGDDETLKKMRRPYNAKMFLKKINSIRKKMPDIGITTDVIVGFPTETEENFKKSYDFIKKCGFSRLHIFRFSPRPGTDAEKIKSVCRPHQIAECEKILKSLDAELRSEFAKKFKGKKLEVLTEAKGRGYTSNYIQVKLPDNAPVNEIIEYEQ